MGRLDGKVALITGGGTGIGEATARVFAREGARVAVMGRREQPLRDVVERIEAAGGEGLALPGDQSKPEDVRRVVEAVRERFGPITVLFNNGALGPDEPPFHEIPDEFWDEIMEVNVRGLFLLTRAVIPEMLEAGGGSIINNASRLAVQAMKGFSAYTASKGAMVSLTRSLAAEYAEHHIRVNVILPGLVVTEMGGSLLAPYLSGEKPIWDRAPLGRLGEPEDIALGALYLASDDSAWVTGIMLPIDGGRSVL